MFKLPIRELMDTPHKASKYVNTVTGPDFFYSAPIEEVQWEFDYAAIQNAATYLGLTWPIKLEKTNLAETGFAQGFYLCESNTHIHEIRLWNCLDHEHASIGIWHEMTHGRQAESYDSPIDFLHANKHYYAKMETWEDYAEIPIEYEALHNHVLHFDHSKLTRKTHVI